VTLAEMSDVSPGPNKRAIEKMVRRRATDPAQSPLLASLPENLTYGVWSAVRRLLGEATEIRSEPPSLVRFGDYCETAEPDSVFGTFRLSEWGGNGLIVMESRLVDVAVETLLGGGKVASTAPEERELTSVDRAIAGRFIRVAIDELARAFARTEQNVGPLTAKLVKLESNARLLTVARRQDTVTKASFEVVLSQGEHGGRLDLLLPDAILEPARRKPRHRETRLRQSSDAPAAGPLLAILPETPLTLHAVVDRLTLSLADVAAWQEGTLLPLDVDAERPVVLYGERESGPGLGRQMFVGRLGASRGRKAVRIIAANPEPGDKPDVEVLP
jgi:flagellar motor switch protein FliM